MITPLAELEVGDLFVSKTNGREYVCLSNTDGLIKLICQGHNSYEINNVRTDITVDVLNRTDPPTTMRQAVDNLLAVGVAVNELLTEPKGEG
jgi:hypothetical protein